MNKMDVRSDWQAGVQKEVDFWRAVFIGKQFPEYKQDMLQRLDANNPLMPWIGAHLPQGVPVADVRILDVAAGPVSCVGWQIGGQRPRITPVDALARQYRAILDEFNLVPPEYTQLCDGEEIGQSFSPSSFDVVHIRNALDHCYDALAVVRNMLAVLKPGGMLLIHGFTDEAEFERYDGLHQWNIRGQDGQLVIWRPGARHVVNKVFANELASIEVNQDDVNRWTGAALQKQL